MRTQICQIDGLILFQDKLLTGCSNYYIFVNDRKIYAKVDKNYVSLFGYSEKIQKHISDLSLLKDCMKNIVYQNCIDKDGHIIQNKEN